MVSNDARSASNWMLGIELPLYAFSCARSSLDPRTVVCLPRAKIVAMNGLFVGFAERQSRSLRYTSTTEQTGQSLTLVIGADTTDEVILCLMLTPPGKV